MAGEQPRPLVAPPWDEWASWEDGPDVWRDDLDSLAAWVSWLREAYRIVELPPCWPDHEGLRIELRAFWHWWLALHGLIPPEQFGSQVGTLVSWHDYLRRAADVWRERYASCDHEGVQVDQVGRPREKFRGDSAHFVDRALEHENEARSAWPRWTPVTTESAGELRSGL